MITLKKDEKKGEGLVLLLMMQLMQDKVTFLSRKMIDMLLEEREEGNTFLRKMVSW